MLTADQLTAIDHHLRSHLHKTHWLQHEDFIDEITDHYANGISERMNRSDSFDTALTGVYDSFGQSTGLKKLELTYWKLSSREFRKKIVDSMLTYFSFPLIFVTASLIALFLLARFSVAWIFSAPFGSPAYSLFNISLFCVCIFSLLTTLLTKYSRYAGQFRPLGHKILFPLRTVTKGLLVVFNLEMFSSPLLIGRASPYVGTLLYTVSILLYLSYRKEIRTYRFLGSHW